MSEGTFTEDDLAPGPEERSRARAATADRAAAAVAAIAAGVVVGGMIALGACAAPAVFALAPAPHSGYAMGAAFARFDRVAIGASVILLAAEVVRTYLARRRRPEILARVRRLAAFALAGCAAIMGLSVSPSINELHAGGARRGEGEQFRRLEAIHQRAETIGRIEVVVGLVLVGLHVFTVRRAPDDDGEAEPVAPLAPGPR